MNKWLVILLTLLVAGTATAQDYPRLTCYHGGTSGGAPFVKADGTLDDVLIKLTSRYPMVTINPNAAALRPDFVARLRYYNKDIKIIFYDQHSNWHLDSTFIVSPTDTTFYAEKHRAIQWAHAWLTNKLTSFTTDWKQQDGADTLIRLYVKHTKQFRPDGWFFDYFNPISLGTYGITEDDDYNRLYHTRRLVSALHAAMPGLLVFGNGPGYGQERCGLDGGMDEGFPYTQTPFSTAIKQEPGYWLKSESAVGTSGNATLAAYTAGVACLTGAYIEHGNSHYTGAPEQGTWWFPFYSVAPDGTADASGRYIGWLGQPLGAPTKLSSTTWRRQFVGPFIDGCVVVNTNTSAQTIAFGGTYKLIGSSSNITSTLVAAQSAVFVWRAK